MVKTVILAGFLSSLLLGCAQEGSKTAVFTDSELQCEASCKDYLDSKGNPWPSEYQENGVCACINPEYQG